MNRKTIAGSIFLAAAAIYIESSLLFVNRFPFHTTINGVNVSLLSEQAAIRKLTNLPAHYVLTINGRGNLQDTIRASEIGLKNQVDPSLAKLASFRGNYAWPLSLFTHRDYRVMTTPVYDEDRLAERAKNLIFYDKDKVINPSDAVMESVGDTYTIVPEEEGTRLNEGRTMSAIEAALSDESSFLDLDAEGCYEAPGVTSDDSDLVNQTQIMNKFGSLELTLQFGDAPDEQETIDANTIASWVSSEENGTVTFDAEAIRQYVDGLNEKYTNFGADREFRTTEGRVITVKGGNYGYWLDVDATAQAIQGALTGGTGGTLDPVWHQKGNAFGTDDIGDSYVEIDLDNQHVYVYEDGELKVETDCVSGKATNGHATPDGVYHIAFKQLDATLRGENYESHVHYWMPFNMGIGLHDATWRSRFGGDLYVRGGSHGCINLPLDKAKEIYELVYSGEPVIVYGGIGQDTAQTYKPTDNGTAAPAGTVDSDGGNETEAQQADAASTANAAAQAQAAYNATVQQAIANYEAVGMTPEQAAAQVQADIAAQVAAAAGAAAAPEAQ